MYKTESQFCAAALQVQDACNASGVAISLADGLRLLCAQGLGTDERNRHPAVQLFVYKLAALAGFEPLDWGLSEDVEHFRNNYRTAERYCQEKAAT